MDEGITSPNYMQCTCGRWVTLVFGKRWAVCVLCRRVFRQLDNGAWTALMGSLDELLTKAAGG